jgi:hypothetical protein
MRTPIVVLAILFLSTTASAERVGVVVTGEATVQPQIAARVERWLQERGRDVVPGPLAPEAINTLIDCFVLEDLGCARNVIDVQAKSNAVVFTRADMTQNPDGTRDIAITGYWFQKAHDAVAERRVCEQCTEKSLQTTVDDLMLILAHESPTRLAVPVIREQEEPNESPMKKWLPVGLVGAGGLMVISGVVMIAIDEDPDPVGKQAPTLRDTATAGAVIGVLGVAAVGAGAYLWRRNKQSAPVAAISSDGGYVGWAGRF